MGFTTCHKKQGKALKLLKFVPVFRGYLNFHLLVFVFKALSTYRKNVANRLYI